MSFSDSESKTHVTVQGVARRALRRAFAVWKQYLQKVQGSGRLGSGSVWQIGAAVRPGRRGSWLVRDRLGREAEPGLQGDNATEQPGPHLAADGRGDAIAVWQGGTVSRVVTHYAVWKASGHAWSRPASASRHLALWPQVVSSPAGKITLVWQGPDANIQAASTQIARRRRSTTLVTSKADSLDATITSATHAIAIWQQPTKASGDFNVKAAVYTAGH